MAQDSHRTSGTHDLGAPETRARLNAIAHDFNNLLTVINGYSDLLLKQLEDGDVREQIVEIRQAGGRASELTQQFLSIVRPPVAEADGGGDDVLAGLEAMVGRADAQPDAAGEVTRGRGETVLLVEDQAEVRRVAVRVLSRYGYHVLHAAGAEEAVAEASAFDGPIHLLITDMVLPGTNGRQLASRLLQLRPDLRVLFVSGYPREHLIAQQWLDATSPFLAKPFEADALAAAVRASLPSVRRAGSILVVDDEEGVRRLLSGVLESAGYEVVSASDGRQAEKILDAREFDLVLMDLVMPDREGIETIAELRRERPALKIIAISGFGGTFLQVARRLGARATLAKPISPDELLRVVEETLVAP